MKNSLHTHTYTGREQRGEERIVTGLLLEIMKARRQWNDIF